MKGKLRIIRVSLSLTLAALVGLGCAQVQPLLAAFQAAPLQLEAQGPGTVFRGVECAAVDALTYAYLQARSARDGRMRGGTIYATAGGYSYDEIVVGSPSRVSYRLAERDVARFHVYAPVSPRDRHGISERLTKADRRSVRFVDPRHRPLFVLHPSLGIRAYGGNDPVPVMVADLRSPKRIQPVVVAGGPTPSESAAMQCSRSSISSRTAADQTRRCG